MSRRPLLAAPREALPSQLMDALHTGVALSVVLGIGLSALPILTGDAKERNERRYVQPGPDEEADNLKWGIMSVLAAVPFLSPLGWVFGALDDEESSALYWSLAALYSLPYLTSGLRLDSFAVATLLAGAVHMQIERVARTEPAEVELPQAARSLLRRLPGAVVALGRYGAQVGGEVAQRTRRADDAARRRPDRKYLEEQSREARAELEKFDRKQRQRQRQKDGER